MVSTCYPFGSYYTGATIDFSKASLAGEIVSAFASTAALVRPKQGSANFLTLVCTALKHDLASWVGFLLCEHSSPGLCPSGILPVPTRLDFCIPSSVANDSTIWRVGNNALILSKY